MHTHSVNKHKCTHIHIHAKRNEKHVSILYTQGAWKRAREQLKFAGFQYQHRSFYTVYVNRKIYALNRRTIHIYELDITVELN